MIKVENIDIDNRWEFTDKYETIDEAIDILNDSVQQTNFMTEVKFNSQTKEGFYTTIDENTGELISFGLIYEVMNRARLTVDELLDSM
tara:strand:+ start:1732 stop:1995 length:264 start_codon:yes stop_codon:yes gene_type:complete